MLSVHFSFIIKDFAPLRLPRLIGIAPGGSGGIGIGSMGVPRAGVPFYFLTVTLC